MKTITETTKIISCQFFSCQNFHESLINIPNETCGPKGICLQGYKVLTTPNCRPQPLNAHPEAVGTENIKGC